MDTTHPMIRFIVDSKPVEWDRLWYHHQKAPWPGGYTYSIQISRQNHEVISAIEKGLELKIENPLFIKAAQEDDSSFSGTVVTILYAMKRLTPKNSDTNLSNGYEWVLNNIRNVLLTDETLIVTGDCSPFIESFEKPLGVAP